jgi:hypothetical protein
VQLKSASRIEGLACCEFIALLTQCLIERELRAAMTSHAVAELALYHEGRATRAPTAARVFDLFTEAARHHLTSQDGKIVQIFEPELNDLQRQVLDPARRTPDRLPQRAQRHLTRALTARTMGGDIGPEKCGTRGLTVESELSATRMLPVRPDVSAPRLTSGAVVNARSRRASSQACWCSTRRSPPTPSWPSSTSEGSASSPCAAVAATSSSRSRRCPTAPGQRCDADYHKRTTTIPWWGDRQLSYSFPPA